jgi:hypothetical protein
MAEWLICQDCLIGRGFESWLEIKVSRFSCNFLHVNIFGYRSFSCYYFSYIVVLICMALVQSPPATISFYIFLKVLQTNLFFGVFRHEELESEEIFLFLPLEVTHPRDIPFQNLFKVFLAVKIKQFFQIRVPNIEKSRVQKLANLESLRKLMVEIERAPLMSNRLYMKK